MAIFLVGLPGFPFLTPLKSVHGYPVVPIGTLSANTLSYKQEGLRLCLGDQEFSIYIYIFGGFRFCGMLLGNPIFKIPVSTELMLIIVWL